MTEAMRAVPPVMAGAASGTLNTSRQLGSAIGGAVIGAVLQNQLATALHQQSVAAASRLPEPVRQSFVDGFAGAAAHGLQVGPGQAGGASLPAGMPPQAAQLVHEVFVNAYATAMRPALAVVVAGALLGAMSCALIARRARGASEPVPSQEPSAA